MPTYHDHEGCGHADDWHQIYHQVDRIRLTAAQRRAHVAAGNFIPSRIPCEQFAELLSVYRELIRR